MLLGYGVAEGAEAKGHSTSSLTVPVLLTHPQEKQFHCLHRCFSLRVPLRVPMTHALSSCPHSRTAQEVAARKTEPDIPESQPRAPRS